MHTHPADTSQESVAGLNCFLDRVLTTVTRTVYPELDLNVRDNAQYDQDQQLDLLIHISLGGAFANIRRGYENFPSVLVDFGRAMSGNDSQKADPRL